MKIKRIAVDFDGTLCTDSFPEIGAIEPKHQKIIDYIKHEKENGATIILWTCREDVSERPYLTEAIEWCKKQGVPIDHVNVYYQPEFGGFASRKVCADVYIDDKAVNMEDFLMNEIKVDKYEKHRKICEKLNQTYIDKNTAYGDSFGRTFEDLGIISAITRMQDKFNRIVALTKGAENNVKDEAIEDTLFDLANYAIMTLIEIENQEK